MTQVSMNDYAVQKIISYYMSFYKRNWLAYASRKSSTNLNVLVELW